MALISFDLDGVLQRNPFYIGGKQGIFGYIRRELAPHFDGPDPERAAVERIVALHRARLQSDDLLVSAFDWDEMVNQVAAAAGYRGHFDIAALVEEYCQIDGLVYAYPGAAETMDALRAAGHTLVSITNGLYKYQAPVLRQIGLLEKFEYLFTPDRTGAAKPQAGIYTAAERYGSPRIHIGDALAHDIGGAKGAGWLGIYVVQPGAPGATELPPKLAALPPWERPAAGADWLAFRLEQDRRWHGPSALELADCQPDAIVQSLHEIPATVAALLL